MRMILFEQNVHRLIWNDLVDLILTILFLTATGLLSSVIEMCDQSDLNEKTGISVKFMNLISSSN